MIDIVLLTLLVIIAIAIIRMKDLFAVVMLAGIYGLLSASFFVAMDAVDVAFTEAAVGAGISTLLMLVVITMTGREEKPTRHKPLSALRRLYESGFRTFMRERNIWSFQPWPGIRGLIANVKKI